MSEFLSQYGWLILPIIGCILGWSTATRIVGNAPLDFSFLGALKLAFKIPLAMAIGWFVFLFKVIKLIITLIARAITSSKEKKAVSDYAENASNAQNSSEGND
jgi:surface polysaccharide O-acyltransferase-like enzyme